MNCLQRVALSPIHRKFIIHPNLGFNETPIVGFWIRSNVANHKQTNKNKILLLNQFLVDQENLATSKVSAAARTSLSLSLSLFLSLSHSLSLSLSHTHTLSLSHTHLQCCMDSRRVKTKLNSTSKSRLL